MTAARASRRSGSARRRGLSPLALCLAVTLALSSTAAVLAGGAPGGPAAPDAAPDAGPGGSYADFNPAMLSGSARHAIDLSRFEQGNPVLPGQYNVDVYLNGTWIGRMDVRFASPTADASALPCTETALLERLGLAPAKPSEELAAKLADPAACVPMDAVIPGATMAFDLSALRLDVSVPQAFLGQQARGYVSPENWDAGVPAALLNYRFNSYRTTSHGSSQVSSYLGLNAGLNIGLWHLREDATFSWRSGSRGQPSSHHWQTINAYVRRDLPKMRATLTVGDSFTDGAVFDSLGLRGVQLATDDRMLPESRRGYAPVVRGVAQSNAKVTVRQNGVQLVQTTVAPGPFVISDLYPTGYGGDLEVTVTEADGREHSFSVPYASVAQLLRTGITRWSVAAGELRNDALLDSPNMAQATVQRGFSNLVTGYAGVQVAEDYAAALVGAAFNTRLGALAVDLTQSHARLPGLDTQSGQSLRLTYSKIIPTTNTSLSVAAYRYSTGGFLSLGDAAIVSDQLRRGLDPDQYLPPDVALLDGVPELGGLTPAQRAALGDADYSNPLRQGILQHQRSRFTLSLNQRLGDRWGSLYANASVTDYWADDAATDTQYQVGYTNVLHGVSYSVSAMRTRDAFGRKDNQFHLSLSVPLGNAARAPNFNLNINHDEHNGNQAQAMVSGSLGEYSQFNYSATASHGEQGGTAASVSAGYRSPWGVYNASYGHGDGYSQASVSAAGGIVAYAGGVTFSQPLGDTVGLVHVPGAAGAHINNAVGAQVDGDGYAVIPYLTPYKLNTIRIDPKGLPLGVELGATSAQVAPYAGAVVLVDFKTRTGRALIARIRRADGTPVPFGAEVLDAHGAVVGMVGQSGQALLRVAQPTGQLSVRWNGDDDDAPAHSCRFDYAVDARATSTHSFIDARCAAAEAPAAASPAHAKVSP
ncbi:MAG TPA: fimbria/pilus outer membrane usher protein [Rhodanobacteraceae bacterium]|nr:fimbria/pilus outer membrane usher protein [Rhodanobacteraceae bacterium]